MCTVWLVIYNALLDKSEREAEEKEKKKKKKENKLRRVEREKIIDDESSRQPLRSQNNWTKNSFILFFLFFPFLSFSSVV